MAQIAGNTHTCAENMSHPPPLLSSLPSPSLLSPSSSPLSFLSSSLPLSLLLSLSSHPRNRAIHGDIVAVSILSRSEWKYRSTTLPRTPADSDHTHSSTTNEQGHSQVETMPTGVVVGVLHRASREYVASFPVSFNSGAKQKEGVPLIIS